MTQFHLTLLTLSALSTLSISSLKSAHAEPERPDQIRSKAIEGDQAKRDASDQPPPALNSRVKCDQLDALLADPTLTRQSLSDYFAPSTPQRRRYRRARKLLFSQVAPDRATTPPMVTALYTGLRKPSNTRRAPAGFNCEHLWPRAWMSAKRSSAYRQQEADLHNLFPSEIKVNSRRGHLPFGVVVDLKDRRALPSQFGYDARGIQVVEIRDQFKGDVARALTYMAVRWEMNFPQSQDQSILAHWSNIDPPSKVERERDARIQALQGNVNPLVHCPQSTQAILEKLSELPRSR